MNPLGTHMASDIAYHFLADGTGVDLLGGPGGPVVASLRMEDGRLKVARDDGTLVEQEEALGSEDAGGGLTDSEALREAIVFAEIVLIA